MICVKELVKNFDDVCAVNNITLNIPEGECSACSERTEREDNAPSYDCGECWKPMAAALSLTCKYHIRRLYLKRFFICRMILFFFRTPLWKKMIFVLYEYIILAWMLRRRLIWRETNLGKRSARFVHFQKV